MIVMTEEHKKIFQGADRNSKTPSNVVGFSIAPDWPKGLHEFSR